MNQWYLIKYDDNWADEMDVSGHTVINASMLQKFEEAIAKKPYFTFYIGTNEEIEYNNTEYQHNASDVYTVEAITQSQYDVLKELGLASNGLVDNFIQYVIEASDEMEQD